MITKDSGYIMQLQNMSVNDGEGIRTNIFLAGCPMQCPWCSNPEGQSLLNPMTSMTTTTEVMKFIKKQMLFYRYSGGGVTFSGGEATQQVEFLRSLTTACYDQGISMAIEICEDLWMPNAPSSNHAIHGANLILNLSASNEIISKSTYRKNLVTMQSAKCIAAYCYASAGPQESTTDIVFSGHKLIAMNGELLRENSFNFEDYKEFICSTIDFEKLQNDRIKFNSFMGNVPKENYIHIPLNYKFYFDDIVNNENDCFLQVNPYPFVPKLKSDLESRCKNIINIQSTGLAQRMSTSTICRPIIGISGGLDSTLALLVTIEAIKKINKPLENIIGVTMPGFGTTSRTLDNSLKLMSLLGITTKNISIVDACIQHFKDIEHDPNNFNITYENVQARERTQILMDIANKENGLVIGTGDMSELALGWCTYNGDHMSMYAVNSSIPKTLVKYLVQSIGEIYNKKEDSISKEIANVLFDICDTPISPELLPKDKDGNMVQKTEETIGKYDIHDFVLFHMIRNGYSPTKIYKLAKVAFLWTIDDNVILNTMKTFYTRFFQQQFKRSCLPDGPKVGSVALSPRGDWRMPSDACANIWIDEIKSLIEKNN